MKIPKAVENYMREFGESAQDARTYILDQIQFYATIPEKSNPVEWWIAFKLGSTMPAASAAIRWAKGTAA